LPLFFAYFLAPKMIESSIVSVSLVVIIRVFMFTNIRIANIVSTKFLRSRALIANKPHLKAKHQRNRPIREQIGNDRLVFILY
jgi:hypothetical protein